MFWQTESVGRETENQLFHKHGLTAYQFQVLINIKFSLTPYQFESRFINTSCNQRPTYTYKDISLRLYIYAYYCYILVCVS